MRDIRIRCLTFNVATSSPPTDVEELRPLLGIGKQERPKWDIFALALQEVSSLPTSYFSALVRGEDDWSSAFAQLLNYHEFVKVESIRVLGTVIALFVHFSYLDRLRAIEAQYLRLTTEGFKSSLAIRFTLYGISLCFVNSHLSAHNYNYAVRLDEYERTLNNIRFNQELTKSILFHDYIFWLGDLNFRVDADLLGGHKAVESLVKKNELKPLLDKDQLTRARLDQKAFHDLEESEPFFAPTYKFVFESNEYDLKRCPSWTDRILYRCNHLNYEQLSSALSVTQHDYESHMVMKNSDHKPVTSEFSINVFEDCSQMAQNVMDFEPIIDFHDMGNVKLGSDFEVKYDVKQGTSDCLKQWDWIGLYKVGVLDLARYVSFTWASECRLSSETKSVVILGEMVTNADSYCLVFVAASKAVLGVSQVFQIS